jgi:hypothetical protein
MQGVGVGVIPTVQPGDAITAELFNMLVAGVLGGGGGGGGKPIVAGHGIAVVDGPAGVTVSVARLLAEHVRLGVIEARSGQEIDEARNVRYTVLEYGTTNRLVDRYPDWGRPTKRDDVEIAGARVGSYCWIFRQPGPGGVTTAKLWIPAGGIDGETLAFYECERAPGPIVGSVVGRPVEGGGGGGATDPGGGGGVGLPPVDAPPDDGTPGGGVGGGIK